MANEHEPDFGRMWQQQPRRDQAMPVEEVRRRAAEFDAKVERWKLVGAVTVALLIVKNIWEVWVDTDMLERAGDALMVLALVFIVYRFWRHSRPERVPSTLGRMSCVEHYRAKLVRERELSHDAWAYVLPFVPGFGVIILPRAFQGRTSSQVAVLIALAIIMFAVVLWIIARGRRTIEREIAALAGE
jgi:cbb3-type cytochrome oxidase subunit 3